MELLTCLLKEFESQSFKKYQWNTYYVTAVVSSKSASIFTLFLCDVHIFIVNKLCTICSQICDLLI